MRQNPCFYLRNLAGVPYLLPFGQAQADFKRSMRLNETGAFLWESLARDRSEEELLETCARRFGASGGELPRLRADIRQFLSRLAEEGCLLDEPPGEYFTEGKPGPRFDPARPGDSARYLSIAGLNLLLEGAADAFPEEFRIFETVNPRGIHQTLRLICEPPKPAGEGAPLIRNRELMVFDCGGFYSLRFPGAAGITEARLQKDGSLAAFYYKPPCTADLREALFHGIRLAFLYLALNHRYVALHSASLLYRDKIWLFSAPSGTGKSTHTNLWHRFGSTRLVNGDLNLLAMEGETPLVHGIPWCGTSGIRDTGTYPLGGILLLKQSAKNRVEELSPEEKILLIQQRLISPFWTAGMLEESLSLVEKLTSHILVCRLHCTISEDAVKTAKGRIDSFLP